MSVLQFLRIFWARKWLIILSPLCCLIGAYAVTLVAAPRWQATAEVMLNTLTPDPVTGEVINGHETQAYVATQTSLITDYSVAGRVVDELGLSSDPNLIAQYQSRSKKDVRDFRHWAADNVVIANTTASLIPGSNILEIAYTTADANNAKRIADAVRQAYIDANVAFRRDDATRNGQWFQAQAERAKIALDASEAVKADYERQNGVVMQDDKVDVDSERLRAIALQGAGATAAMVPEAAPTSESALQLAQVDAQIAQESRVLGPNHPDMLTLKAKRDNLAALVVRERQNKASEAAAATGAMARAVDAQRARVIAERDKLARLTELQADVDLKRSQYDKAAARAADLFQQASTAEAGITPLGSASTPKAPAFPNMLLIVPGSIVLGFGVGVLVALLMEFFDRRIRGEEDLRSAVTAPLLAVIAAPPRSGRPTSGPGHFPPLWQPPRRRMA